MEGNWRGSDKILIEKMGGRSDSDFYIVDLRENKVEKVGGILLNRYHPGGLTAVDNLLFAIGSSKFNGVDDDYKYNGEVDILHDGASYYDLSSPFRKWKPLNAMMLIPGRRNPFVVSLFTKIFAFGGAYRTDGDSCFGEYYDTANKSAGWRPISRPSYVPLEYPLCFTDPNNHRIICLFTIDNSLFAYYPNKPTPHEQWLCLYDHGVYLRRSLAATSPAADGVLFYFLNDVFTAYDINTNTKLRVSWSSRKPFGPRQLYKYTFSYFIHLGDDILCLPVAPLGDPTATNIEFYRFLVHRHNANHVIFTPLSVHRIQVPGLPLPCNYLPL